MERSKHFISACFNKGVINMLSIKKFENVNWKPIFLVAFACLVFMLLPDASFAAETTGSVQTKLKNAGTAIQSVLTAIAVIVGVVAALKIIVKHLPNIDDPHTKNEMWKALGGVLAAVAASAAIIWIAPWVYSLFK
ncbi:conjugal transfer protein (plasmid) [Niallia circulans]|uniref:Conjugal transfer protein n=2 Tax=Niallia circulans TaxID=1397 RepID=A0A553SQL0_NIACI|nr:conjugal transfer protein [Niallia circulans]